MRRLTGNDRLSLGDNIRDQADALYRLIPDRPYLKSSDPQGVRARLYRYETLRRQDPDSLQLFTLLAAILIRLDRADTYPDLVERIPLLGEHARPPLQDILDNMNPHDQTRQTILHTARQMMQSLESSPTA